MANIPLINVEAFHHLLRNISDRNGAVSFTQVMMCGHLSVSKWKMSTLIDSMVENGMVERVSKRGSSPVVLKVL